MLIKEFQALQNVEFKAIISNVTTGKTNGNNKTNYLTIQLQDQSGTIDAKLWNCTDEQMATLVIGCCVDVKGDVIKYGEDLQLKIEKISIYSTEESEQVKYLRQAPLDKDEMASDLLGFISEIKDPVFYDITSKLYEEYFEKLIIYPAASKNHHEYVSGLAYHTLSMLKIAKSVATIHPHLNTDYLYSGILLHDLGKIVELSGPVIPEYTLEGKLLGHISISQAMIYKKAQDLGYSGEKVTILQHLILSHHGKQEYGSPILPLIAEAEVIYLIDNLDAKINMLQKALDGVEEGHCTKRIFPLDNRIFYKPHKD